MMQNLKKQKEQGKNLLKNNTLSIFVFDCVQVSDSYKQKSNLIQNKDILVVCTSNDYSNSMFVGGVGYARPPTVFFLFSNFTVPLSF